MYVATHVLDGYRVMLLVGLLLLLLLLSLSLLLLLPLPFDFILPVFCESTPTLHSLHGHGLGARTHCSCLYPSSSVSSHTTELDRFLTERSVLLSANHLV